MSTRAYPDVSQFLDAIAQKGRSALATTAAHVFDPATPVFVARAPGRLDVMGGIADYSGALVLQMPIAEATIVALQFHSQADPASAPQIRATSLGDDAGGRGSGFVMPVSDLFSGDGGSATELSNLHAYFARLPDNSKWAAYVIGVLGVLAHEPETSDSIKNCGGCSILVTSSVPEGKGVSSSAAVEVATMMATLGALDVSLAPSERVAQLCQRVENFVVGAPCGIMDQMASALGHASQLLALVCQPARVEAPVAIPAGMQFWGIDSGVRHSVGGSDYGTVRCATFMARAVLRSELKARAQKAAAAAANGAGTSPLGLPASVTELDHLVTLSPSLFAEIAACLPVAITGKDFLARYGGHGDNATAVDPATTYDLRGCASHPVHEHARVSAFRLLLLASLPSAEAEEARLVALGELMYQSHASYTAIGLGSDATEELVRLVRSLGPASGLYGAKITGGGSGGTVCVLGAKSERAEASFAKVVAAYKASSGHTPHVFAGSSPGAIEFGHIECHLTKGAAQLEAALGKRRKRRRDP